MPELPEVQTVVDDLNKKVKGETIADFWTDWAKTIKNESVKSFTKQIKNKKIVKAHRIGKNIFLDLSGGLTINIHLKMTGHLLIKRKRQTKEEKKWFSDKVNGYIHHIFILKNGTTIEFSDLRKFGKILLIETKKIKDLKEIKSLGIDALDKEFTLGKFNELLEKKPNAKIGIFIMDQAVIAGLGNIYRSEVLFDAKINPDRRNASLTEKEIEKIYHSIGKILKKAIELRGTSDADYRDTSGAPGKNQKILKVYRKEKERCPKCATIIKRIKMGQRSVFYCPTCQK